MNADRDLRADSLDSIPGSDRTDPCVGIFWMIMENDRSVLLTDRTSLVIAEPYGDCLTHAGGHYEFWETLKARGTAALTRAELPTVIVHREYEEFPRGRVVYRMNDETFIIYADRRLHNPIFVDRIIEAFGLSRSLTFVLGDPHYRS